MAVTHDVFLSYSAQDKGVVSDLAARLRDRGLRVWFDDWEIAPGDSVPARIEAGLEGSAVLVLCMSQGAFASPWASLESQTFRFRDPLNRDRRFIPLRLDDTSPPGSLGQFLAVDWRVPSKVAVDQLVRACSASPPALPTAPELDRLVHRSVVSLGHTDWVRSVAYHPDGTHALSGADDNTLRVWDLATGTCERVLEDHTGGVNSVAYHPDGTHALSGADDNTLRVWDLATGTCERVLEGHTGTVLSVAYHPDGTHGEDHVEPRRLDH